MSENKKNLNMRHWMLAALVLGVVLGAVLYAMPASPVQEVILDGVCRTVGGLFLAFIGILAFPLLITSVACGTSSMGDVRVLGKKGVKLMVLYVGTTAVAVCIALIAAALIQPGDGLNLLRAFPEAGRSIVGMVSMLQLQMHQGDAIGFFIGNGIFWMLLFSLLVGVAMARLKERVEVVTNFLRQLNSLMMELTVLTMRVVPLAILCLTAQLVGNLGPACVLPLVKYVVAVLLALGIQCFVVYMVMVAAGTGLRPFKLLNKLAPVIGFAFSTATSSATIAMTIDTLENRVGVPRRISSYTIPLGNATNMDGTAIMQGVAVVFVAQACGMELSLLHMVLVGVCIVIASMGSAGVPGTGIVALALMLWALGLPLEGVGLILGVDRLLDMCRTAVNITGDAICTTIVASQAGELDRNIFDKRADA